MDQTAIPWIMLVSVIVAAISAGLSWRASQTAANLAATNLILKFRDQYASNEMFVDLRNLRAWYDRHGSSRFAKTWQQQLQQNDPDAEIVDRSRRRVTSFFSDIIDLHDAGLVPKRIEKLLTHFAGFDLLYTVVEPLENALNPNYDRALFDRLRMLRPPRVLGQFPAINWVIKDP